MVICGFWQVEKLGVGRINPRHKAVGFWMDVVVRFGKLTTGRRRLNEGVFVDRKASEQ